QKLLLTEGRAEEGDADWKVVSGESRGHDQVRKTREIGEVRRRSRRACGSGVGRRGKQCRPAGRCWIHDRVKLLCREETLEGCTHQRQAVITDGCVAVVLETSARCFTLERGPATWIRARAILTWCGETICPVDQVFDRLGIVRPDGREIILDLRCKFRHPNRVVEFNLRFQ